MFVVLKIAFSYNDRHDMTNSIIEIFQVGVQLPKWQVTLLHLYAGQYVQVSVGKRLCTLPSYPSFGESRVFRIGALALSLIHI